MPFSQSAITGMSPPEFVSGGVFLSWTSTSPSGTWFQVYAGGKLAWWGQTTWATIPFPTERVRIDVGTVAVGEQATDFSPSLIVRNDRVKLTWQGGTSEASDIASFRVYGEASPGSGVNYSTPLADISASTGGIAPGLLEPFAWISNALSGGTWQFAIVPVDAAGNEGAVTLISQYVQAPPLPPAINASGERLTYTYNQGSFEVTLNWLASPG